MILRRIYRAYKSLGARRTIRLIYGRLSELFLSRTASEKDFKHSLLPPRNIPEIFLDVSEISAVDWGTGIQRVTRSLASELLNMEGLPYTIRLVYATENSNGYYEAAYERHGLSKNIVIRRPTSSVKQIRFAPGDIFFGLDWAPLVVRGQQEYFDFLSENGIKVVFLLHDILPVTHPHFFPAGSYQKHVDWLETICRYTGIISVSRSSMEQLRDYIKANSIKCRSDFFLAWNHNGADIDTSGPTHSTSAIDARSNQTMLAATKFLMVGTIEPRKGHKEVLDAFKILWSKGLPVKLTIVGKVGWNVGTLIEELDIICATNSLLVYERHIDDAHLISLYNSSDCLIAASYDEGFGLPLIEAAQHKLPLIVRDIPVFREVAGEHAFYFQTGAPEQLALEIEGWLSLYKACMHPESETMPWLSWRQSSEGLATLLINQCALD